MQRKYLVWFLLLQLVFVLGGCSGGNDSASQSRVSVSSVELLSAETFEKGCYVSLSVTLSSDADLNGLGMSYYLLSKDEATQRIDSYHFGSATIPVVSAGEHTYAQSFVFSDDVPAGTYNLLVHVDPLETSLPDDIAYEAPRDVAVTVAEDQGKPDLAVPRPFLVSRAFARRGTRRRSPARPHFPDGRRGVRRTRRVKRRHHGLHRDSRRVRARPDLEFRGQILREQPVAFVARRERAAIGHA